MAPVRGLGNTSSANKDAPDADDSAQTYVESDARSLGLRLEATSPCTSQPSH